MLGIDVVPLQKAIIRPFEPSEWEAFRDFRLKALQSQPGAFSSSYESERQLPDERWQDYMRRDSAQQVFGLFDGVRLIGITAAFRYRGDPTGETAILAMSYIEPEYRGRGLSRLLYEARLDWVRAQPHFKRVVVGHRESNERSKRANQHFGFRYTDRESRTWPDGLTEDELNYELLIPREDAPVPN